MQQFAPPWFKSSKVGMQCTGMQSFTLVLAAFDRNWHIKNHTVHADNKLLSPTNSTESSALEAPY